MGRYVNTNFSKEDAQITKKHMKNSQHHYLLDNRDQNYNEVSSCTGQNGHYQKIYK